MTEDYASGVIAGRDYERERLTRILNGHLGVCNYKAVAEEECDVCAWATDTIALINKS